MDGLRYSPDEPYYRLGPVHTCLYARVRETGDWDLFLGPLEWARAETGPKLYSKKKTQKKKKDERLSLYG